MTAPTHQDRARGMRAVLAKLRNDELSTQFVLDEATTPDDVDRLTRALVDMFGEFMRSALADPHRYAANWVAAEMLKDRNGRTTP